MSEGFLIFRDISGRAGRGFKRFLEAVGFILAKFEPKRSHGDPIRDNIYGFMEFGDILRCALLSQRTVG